MSSSSGSSSPAISSISTGSLHSIDTETFFDYFDPCYGSPFYNACAKDDLELAKEILSNGKVNVNRRDNRGDTFLHTAVKNNSYEVAKLLLTIDSIDATLKNFKGNTPLHLAKTPKILELLIEDVFDLDVRNYMSQTPLLALFSGKQIPYADLHEMMLLLLKNGSNPHVVDDDFETPLLAVLLSGYNPEEMLELVCMLLYYGTDINQKVSPQSPSVFMYVLWYKAPADVVKTLLPYVLDLNEVADFPVLGIESCLSLTFNYEDPLIHEFVWKNCDVSSVFTDHKSILVDYLLKENIPGSIFLKQLYKILSFTDSYYLLETPTRSPLYILLSQTLDRYQIPKSERVKLIYTFLSLSGHIEFSNIIYIYNKYGYDEEFEAFLKTTVDSLYVDLDPAMEYICFPKRSDRVKEARVVSSLKVIARDAFRLTLRGPKNGVFFQYYNDVQNMNVPRVIKDIICYKKILL